MEDILEKYGWPKRADKEEKEIGQVEELVGFNLPKDYKSFLNNFLGGESFLGKEFVQLWDLDSLIELNVNYEILSLLNKTIGIGSNGGGELICIKYDEGRKYEVFLTPSVDPSPENHHSLGESFTAFLKRLDEGTQFFN